MSLNSLNDGEWRSLAQTSLNDCATTMGSSTSRQIEESIEKVFDLVRQTRKRCEDLIEEFKITSQNPCSRLMELGIAVIEKMSSGLQVTESDVSTTEILCQISTRHIELLTHFTHDLMDLENKATLHHIHGHAALIDAIFQFRLGEFAILHAQNNIINKYCLPPNIDDVIITDQILKKQSKLYHEWLKQQGVVPSSQELSDIPEIDALLAEKSHDPAFNHKLQNRLQACDEKFLSLTMEAENASHSDPEYKIER